VVVKGGFTLVFLQVESNMLSCCVQTLTPVLGKPKMGLYLDSPMGLIITDFLLNNEPISKGSC